MKVLLIILLTFSCFLKNSKSNKGDSEIDESVISLKNQILKNYLIKEKNRSQLHHLLELI
jgi:hypothetical protein